MMSTSLPRQQRALIDSPQAAIAAAMIALRSPNQAMNEWRPEDRDQIAPLLIQPSRMEHTDLRPRGPADVWRAADPWSKAQTAAASSQYKLTALTLKAGAAYRILSGVLSTPGRSQPSKQIDRPVVGREQPR